MVVEQSNIDHIMRGLQSTEGVRLHNHRKKLRQRFDIIKKLGQGTYGKVQLGINKETGQEVAIKAVKKCKIKTEADLVRIRREIQIMSSVRHPNIIHIYEVFENREKMVLVMEYAAGGELYDFLSERKVLEEPEARRIFRQISTAVYYCHKHKICHRDLKLENILLDEHGNAKIADFGLSNVYDEQHLLNSFCGSPLYASPEIVKGTPYYGPEVDCWSLGVLLYTLVYGAMPFDGSNFKRLVKQISQGVYFEPKNPSPASALIREMLTVNPQKRATIEQICSHPWVNQGFNVSCLDIAEDLANQTPVRLDLLLSLAPPPENSEKLVVTDDQSSVSQDTPARSLSVGSFMELDPNTEQRIRDFVAQEVPSDNTEKTVKRKLESDASESSIQKEAARKKERTKLSDAPKETEVADEPRKSVEKEDGNQTEMEVDTKAKSLAEEVAVASAKVEEVKEPEETEKVPVEVKPELTNDAGKTEKSPETITKDRPARKSVKVVKKKLVKDGDSEKKEEGDATAESKIKVKKKKKETESQDQADQKEVTVKAEPKPETKDDDSKSVKTSKPKEEKEKPTTTPEEVPPQPKLAERRKSKIFETAEKFMSNDPKNPTQEKPKKVFIPGVKVSDFAKAFERKSSLTGAPIVKSSPSRKSVPKEMKKEESSEPKPEADNSSQAVDNQSEAKAEASTPTAEEPEEERKPTPITDEKLKKLKDSARNIISNALDEEERKKVRKQILKPPVPKAKSEDADSKRPLTLQIGKETATVQVHSPENTKYLFEPQVESTGENKENIEAPKEKKTAKVEITLRSNTLPRGSSTRPEMRMKSPPVEKAGNFRTEVVQRVGDPHARFTTQRSEVSFPVSAAQRPTRSMSLEPELRRVQPQSTKERIIPIQMEGQKDEGEERDRVHDLERPEAKTRMPYQRTMSQKSVSLSRQSTQDSDTDITPVGPGEAIKKSPREFIIPIAVEGGGYVTPRATSLEPSESLTKKGMRPFPRNISLWSDNGSEDEGTFGHTSRDMDEPIRMHRLLSSRPMRMSTDKADSASGSEEEEEDDAFEILTAENLFSTLLSRVRSLTQRLNVEGGVRPGFPSSRLMKNFGPSDRLFSNFHQPLHTRLSDRSDFARSLSRDIENGFNRWNRGDSSHLDSNRSATRDSKPRRSDNDADSISECTYGTLRRKTGEKKSKSRNKTYNPSQESGQDLTNGSLKASVNGYRSLPVPINCGLGGQFYHRQISDSELMDSVHPSLYRTMSLQPDVKKSKELGESDNRVKDFYDILAEKYGITNVKRYDLPQSDGRPSGRKTEEAVEAKTEMKEIGEETEPPVEKEPPLKTKKDDAEKCRTPSEKLAAVLNRWEGSNKAKTAVKVKQNGQQTKTEDVKMEKRPGLSPQAAELYEKTMILYQKNKEGSEQRKSGIPKRITTRHNSDMSVNDLEKSNRKRETQEKSVLGKLTQKPEVNSDDYFNEQKLKHYGSLRSRLSEESRRKKEEPEVSMKYEAEKKIETDEVEKMQQKINRLTKDLEAELIEEEKRGRSKLLTTLDRKLDRFRTEKKYVDKAIRSLRESSVGPKDEISENALIKRAVSLSDCSSDKTGRVQSTVNSVLGKLKKMENPEGKKKDLPETMIPMLRRASEGRPDLKIELPDRPKAKLEATRRSSFITPNRSRSSIFVDDSSSLRSPDSESFDSWSNCSDLGSPDDVSLFRTARPSTTNFDEMSTESVGERIRRKSFYTRFNERKRPRKGSIFDARRRYDLEDGGPQKTEEVSESRPRPFYKSTMDSPMSVYRKTSLDWPRTATSPTLARHASSLSEYATLPRKYPEESRRFYRTGSSERDGYVRPFSPPPSRSPES